MLRHMMTGTWGEEGNTISIRNIWSKNNCIAAVTCSDISTDLDPRQNFSVVAFVSESAREVISGNEKKCHQYEMDCTIMGLVQVEHVLIQELVAAFIVLEQQCIDNCNDYPNHYGTVT